MKVKLINEPIKGDYGAQLLHSRGIEDVASFMAPDASSLQDWHDLANIEDGVSIINQLPATASIALIVDCDVDGFTSASILGQYLQRLLPHITIEYYLHEGKAHGLEEHWEEISTKNYDLLILPDAGSNDAGYAEQINCPILVIDHHIMEVAPSKNMIVINNQTSPNYHNKNLSGAGMAYQFCRALDNELSLAWADDYIDLAALGVCADMMSGLEIENQYIWQKGFKNVKNYFFLSIARKQAYSITGKMGATDKDIIDALDPTSVAFYIVPLINAMVRVGTTEEKRRMLTAFLDGHKMVPCLKRGAKGTMEEAAVESTRECVNARAHQNKFKDEAVNQLEIKIFNDNLLDNKILFVKLEDDDDFPSELTGLIAMQLSQKYKRPTIVARLNNQGYVRGSIRGLANSELTSFKNYLDSTGLFEYVQGHDNAAGCSIKDTDLSKFQERSNKDLANYDFGEDFYEVNFTRGAMAKDIAALITDIVKYKHIWSQGCQEPLIHISDLHFSKKDIQIMGKDGATVKIVKNGIAYMKFFGKDFIEELNTIDGDNIKMEVVGRANVNTWMGTVAPQIFIDQYSITKEGLLDF